MLCEASFGIVVKMFDEKVAKCLRQMDILKVNEQY